MRANLKEILRFSMAGALAGTVDFGVYFLLINFLSFNLSKAISFICAGIVAYVLNKYWTFQNNQPSSYRQVIQYVLVNGLALAINILTNQSILKIWPRAFVLAWIIAAMVTGVVTFLGFKWWVFRHKN